MIQALVGIVMGSTSDWEIMQFCCQTLNELEISFEKRAMSAHRIPDAVTAYAAEARERGVEVIIAAAGGAAHLPGVIAAHTVLPVIGVPMPTSALNGLDSLLSIVQMPREVPVATMAIGKAGAVNAALLAAEILGIKYPDIQARLTARRQAMKEALLAAADLADVD
ncbi:MAG: 5-(carboxyamino)imidazole ribonucleotide mutase [Firmicutes bacterium]|jgi:5-(carboxyamino)imidazole ribonucleotide mutase|nr:5-(carboxyamino)imidazole ribonucleotide mutase [Bacillota bacterium]NLL87516.1 5-(carboxyamino)imidazole ribonucleotide mutase [Bacillota bacterium]HKM18167.1 5-(carboxyamino)imidazole ribonucleotide mutase [Limnochordia bacterium]